MHPAAVPLIVVLGGVFISWGTYEAIRKLYELYNNNKEQREYEEYVRAHAEKSQSDGVPVNRADVDDDNEPLNLWEQRRNSFNDSQSELRRRHYGFSDMEQVSSSIYELSEMERSIFNRKSLLAREKELLLKEEAELERQRQLLRSRGNSINGVFDDHEEDYDYNPFGDKFIVNDPSPAFSAHVQPSIGSSSNKNAISYALSDKSDLESWSDINEIQARQGSDSSDSFEAIQHYQL